MTPAPAGEKAPSAISQNSISASPATARKRLSGENPTTSLSETETGRVVMRLPVAASQMRTTDSFSEVLAR